MFAFQENPQKILIAEGVPYGDVSKIVMVTHVALSLWERTQSK